MPSLSSAEPVEDAEAERLREGAEEAALLLRGRPDGGGRLDPDD